jgi:hypothetical protein
LPICPAEVFKVGGPCGCESVHMAIEKLPERMKTPTVARAITSPSGLLLAGAGMSVAILGGLPIAAAAVVGAAVWAGRVAFAIPRKPKQQRVDLSRLGEPWRSYVQDAQLAEARFQTALRQVRPGPLRERLQELDDRIGDGVRECYRIATRGQDLDVAMMTIDVRRIQAELADCQLEQHRAATAGQPLSPSLRQTMEALQSQLASAQRIQAVGQQTRDRLRLLNAQMDEAVAQAVEVSVKGADLESLQPVRSNVENVVVELEALRQGLEEVGGAPSSAATP